MSITRLVSGAWPEFCNGERGCFGGPETPSPSAGGLWGLEAEPLALEKNYFFAKIT